MNRLVIGVESGNSGPSLSVSTEVKDYGSVRERIGYAVDRWLVFATGGGA